MPRYPVRQISLGKNIQMHCVSKLKLFHETSTEVNRVYIPTAGWFQFSSQPFEDIFFCDENTNGRNKRGYDVFCLFLSSRCCRRHASRISCSASRAQVRKLRDIKEHLRENLKRWRLSPTKQKLFIRKMLLEDNIFYSHQ